MIRLSKLTEPVWVEDFPGFPPSLRIKVRRLRASQMEAARAAQATTIRRLRDGREALADYGLDGVDADGAMLNTADPGQMTATGWLIGAVEIAHAAIIEWEGLTDETGKSAPITKPFLALLLEDNRIQRKLMAEIEVASRIVVLEGNVSGVPLNGSSVEETTASPPNTAEAVSEPAPPVH